MAHESTHLNAAGWGLSISAFLVAAGAAILALYMLRPVEFKTWPGFAAAIAFMFPLHLLAASFAAAGLVFLARSMGASVAAGLFGLAALLTALLAIWPCAALGRYARREGVQLSLLNYLANAARLNRGDPEPGRTLQYGTTKDGTKLFLDLWRAEDKGSGALRPAMVMVHGGGWTGGARGSLPEWNKWLNSLGYEVFDVEYRLPPPARWQDQVGDIKCALGWVAAHAADYGVDPGRISLWGNSAGGHLAQLAAYSLGDPGLPPACAARPVAVHSVVNFYGPSELVSAYDISGSLGYARECLTAYIGGPPAQYMDRYRLASPLNHVDKNTPPTITFLGASDRIVTADQALGLDIALARAGRPRETYFLPAADHGFDVNWGGFATQFARAKVRAFLEP